MCAMFYKVCQISGNGAKVKTKLKNELLAAGTFAKVVFVYI